MFIVILAVLEYQKCPVHSICVRCSVPKQVLALRKINWAMCGDTGVHMEPAKHGVSMPNPLTVILLHEKLLVQSRSPPFQTNIMSSDDSLGLGGARCSRSDQVPPSCWAAQMQSLGQCLPRGFFETCTYMIGYDRYLLIVPLRKWVCIQLELGFFRIQITSWWCDWCSWWFWSSVFVGCFVVDSADEIDDVDDEECGIEAHRINSPTTLRMCRASQGSGHIDVSIKKTSDLKGFC